MLAGAILITPASAHITTFNHLKAKHIYTKKVADERFVNVGETATAATNATSATNAAINSPSSAPATHQMERRLYADNTVTYRSTWGFSGIATFTYTISDGQGGTDSALVTVRVRKTSRRGSIC